MARALRDRNIATTVHFQGIHLHSHYARLTGLRPEDLPVANRWSESALTLPLFPQMTERDVDDVGRALEDVLL